MEQVVCLEMQLLEQEGLAAAQVVQAAKELTEITAKAAQDTETESTAKMATGMATGMATATAASVRACGSSEASL